MMDATGGRARVLTIESTDQDRFHVQLQSKNQTNVFVSLLCIHLSSSDYRKDCSGSTATPSMPAGPPLTLGTLVQISLPHRFHYCPKSSPRAGSTLKVLPTANDSMRVVVDFLDGGCAFRHS
jgi:hypothetical protein